jgi:hypothetical protein
MLFFQVENKSHVKSNVCAFILKPGTDANSNEVFFKVDSSVSAVTQRCLLQYLMSNISEYAALSENISGCEPVAYRKMFD